MTFELTPESPKVVELDRTTELHIAGQNAKLTTTVCKGIYELTEVWAGNDGLKSWRIHVRRCHVRPLVR